MRMLLTTATVLAALLSGCAQEQDMDLAERASVLAKTIAAEHDHVTVAELSDWIIKDRREFELIDIRSQEEFAADHIRGARHVPLAGLMEDASLKNLPKGRKVVLYSNGTAHAAQAALLLRLIDRDAYALLGGINYWHAYLNDPDAAGVAEMDLAQRAQYQAVSCFLAGQYVAAAGLPSKQLAPEAAPAQAPTDSLGLGLALGLGSDAIRPADEAVNPGTSADPPADTLGLGLDLGLGGEAAESLRQDSPVPPKGAVGRLLIKAEC